jgi:hypothetical protein
MLPSFAVCFLRGCFFRASSAGSLGLYRYLTPEASMRVRRRVERCDDAGSERLPCHVACEGSQ